MIVVGGKAESIEEARKMLVEVVQNGAALEIFKKFIEAQGGNPAVVDDPSLLPQAKYKIDVASKQSGYISKMEADDIGIAAMLLGAGRATKESTIDLSVGLVLQKKVGDAVVIGDTIVTIHTNSLDVENVIQKLYAHIEISEEKVEAPQLIKTVITE
ncbi:Pyrimidine-nucleoside phosphorylase OS=Ureibacillus acetophenoni OX=614649 GN=SAMN05877842_10439 PE=3 SV=1 [Ureibacillus acetophenoni]